MCYRNVLINNIIERNNLFSKLSTSGRIKTLEVNYERWLFSTIKDINPDVKFLYKCTPGTENSKSGKFITYWFEYKSKNFFIVVSTKEGAGMKAEKKFENEIKDKNSSLYSLIENKFKIKLNEYYHKSTGSLNCHRSCVDSLNIGHLVADYKIWNNTNIFNFSIKQGKEYNIFSGSSINIHESQERWSDINKRIFNGLQLNISKIKKGLDKYSEKKSYLQETKNIKLRK